MPRLQRCEFPLLFLFGGADEEHDDQAGSGGDAEDAEELGEVFAELGELHEIEHVHAEQERTEDDGNDTDQDQELPHHRDSLEARKWANATSARGRRQGKKRTRIRMSQDAVCENGVCS